MIEKGNSIYRKLLRMYELPGEKIIKIQIPVAVLHNNLKVYQID